MVSITTVLYRSADPTKQENENHLQENQIPQVQFAPETVLRKYVPITAGFTLVWGSSPHGPTIVFNHLEKSLRKLHL